MENECMLLTPGPLSVSPTVKDAMLKDVGSRDAYFRTITAEVRSGILALAGGSSQYTVIPIQGSGTFAIEAAIETFIGETDKALVLVNGLYGERILAILRRRRIAVDVVYNDITSQPRLEEVISRLDRDPAITHLCFVHCETTSGILNPYRALLNEARRRGLFTIVDSMSAFGAVSVDAEIDGFDVLVSSSNKCLEAPPGMAFAVVARSRLEGRSIRTRSFCLDLHDQWRVFEDTGEWRSTPPTNVILALHRAISLLMLEGVDRRRARYADVQRRLLDGLEPLGFSPILQADVQSPICLALRTSQWLPDTEAHFQALYSHLARNNLYIYAKLHRPSQSFRIGCIGQIDPSWIDLLVDHVRDFINPRFTPATVNGREYSMKLPVGVAS